MVKEGDKTYTYGWRDKVLNVSENGVVTARYDYHADGQIASVDKNGKSEEFFWDGLALIKRGGTSYVNEPAVTGGNPILATSDKSEKVLFNDMLGSTMGSVSGKDYTAVDMTLFGESKTEDEDTFFTGKPEVDGLGYAFAFRNYRSSLGKWQTADPLGYPDGWNNKAYVNNRVANCIDFLGAKVYWCARDLGSSPLGNHHFLLFVPDNSGDFSGQTHDLGNGVQGFTIGGFENTSNGKLETRPNDDNDIQSVREVNDPDTYTNWYTPDLDLEMHEVSLPDGMSDTEFINQIQGIINSYDDNADYDLDDCNCATWVNTILQRAGISDEVRETLGEFWGIDWGEEDLIPSQHFAE